MIQLEAIEDIGEYLQIGILVLTVLINIDHIVLLRVRAVLCRLICLLGY